MSQGTNKWYAMVDIYNKISIIHLFIVQCCFCRRHLVLQCFLCKGRCKRTHYSLTQIVCRSKNNYERVREKVRSKWIFNMYTNITSKWKHPLETIIYFHLFSKRMFTLSSAWPVHVHDGLVSQNLICTTEMITIFSRICTFIVRKHIICTGFKKEFFCNDSNWNFEKSSFSKYGNSLVFMMKKNLSEPYLDWFMLNPNGKDHVSLI